MSVETERLIQQTKEQVEKLNKNKKNGKGVKFPQSLKDSIIKLSNDMTASDIARAVGVSKTFACTVINRARKNGSPLINNTTAVKKKSISTKVTDNNNLQILEITDQFKSIMKEDVKNPQSEQAPIMRFTTSSGTTIEIFS